MVDQNTFTETIREVAEIIRTSAEPMSREEILGYFKDMELNTEQENMVLEFLLTPHEEPEEEICRNTAKKSRLQCIRRFLQGMNPWYAKYRTAG